MKRPMIPRQTSTGRPGPRRRGFMSVWVALLGLVLIGFLGLAVDAGYMVHTGNQLQNAAEAAALAAAQKLGEGEGAVRDEAVRVSPLNSAGGVAISLDRNASNSAAGDIVLGRFDPGTREFTPGLDTPNAVKVRARRTGERNGGVGLFFGAAFGAGTADITRSAIAMVGGSPPPGLLVLNPTQGGALTVTGNGSTTVHGGSIQVNSSHPRALSATGSGEVNADAIDVVGGYEATGAAQLNPTPHTGAPVLMDPLAGLAPPPFPPSRPGVSLSSHESMSLDPGYYTGGISLSGGSSAVLRPGTYVLGGTGLRLSGGSSVSGEGVMLYITGTGELELTGGGAVSLSPLDQGPYAGITVFQDRADTRGAAITGSAGATHLSGTVYFPSARVTLTGNGAELAMTLIADTVTVTGSGSLELHGQAPPAAAPVFLVQ